ncbi:MAG: winged helix-turn-helix domain-containing protein [Bryobacteraceae bacterium]|nr:winged helix-turn-helix domain-containing protein [Bryobacteraceae bacterium]
MEIGTIYRFGTFAIDPATRTLTKDGVVVPVAPRTFDLLVALAGSDGRLLTKNELLRTVWGDVNVEEASLAFQISTIRKLLGEEGSGCIETVPKHGYRFVAAAPKSSPVPFLPAEGSFRIGTPGLLFAAFGVLMAIGLILTAMVKWNGAPTVPRTLPLTAYPGTEITPGISPDGSQVAFAWQGEPAKDLDIYLLSIGQGSPVPLTRDPHPETNPTWSPDGEWIAFCRGGGEVVLLSARGSGAERVITRPSRTMKPACTADSGLSWLPTSDAVMVAGHSPGRSRAIFKVPLQGGEAVAVTAPLAGTYGDMMPRVSPDGRHLVFLRAPNLIPISATVQLLPLHRDGTPAGPPEPLLATADPANTFAGKSPPSDLEWHPRRNEVLMTGRGSLWGVSIAPLAGTRLYPIAGQTPGPFAISHDGERMVFATGSADLDLWRLPGPASAAMNRATAGAGKPFLVSTRLDTNPQYSPDGKRVAFTSDRSGKLEIWVADADKSNANQLTQQAGWLGSPRWSPDGRFIAYDVVEGAAGKGDIFVIPATGGPARRITAESTHEHVPGWSRDGRWIYYESDASGSMQLWKSEFPSGRSLQVTTEGGAAPYESPDGRWVYYSKRSAHGIWRRPVEGGPEETVVTGAARSMAWGTYDRGGCFLDFDERNATLKCFPFPSGPLSSIVKFPNEGHVRAVGGPGFGVSPDGRWVLYTGVGREYSDLALITNFASLRPQ